MDNKRRLIFYVCLFTCVGIWNFISSEDISFTKYQYESSLAGYRCVPNETAFETDNVFDPVRCSKLCKLDSMCLSFFYQPDSYKCIGCRINPPNPKPTCRHESYPDSEHFRSKEEKDVVLASDTDCKDLIENHCYPTSGLYEISLWMSKKIVTVFCDMETDGGGWTVFQNRFDGSVDFYRNFADYDNGFGELSGEIWLGLKVLHEMTSQGKTELRLDLTAVNDTTVTTYYEYFQKFYIDGSPSYTLHIGPGNGSRVCHGCIGFEDVSGLSDNDGHHFTTYDADRDIDPSINHAVKHRTGWWIEDFTHANLNGVYLTPGASSRVGTFGMYYWKFDTWHSLKSSKMMFRRINI